MGENNSGVSVLYIGSDDNILGSAREHLDDFYGVNMDTSPFFPEGIDKALRYGYDAILSDLNAAKEMPQYLKKRRDVGLHVPFILAYDDAEERLLGSDYDTMADYYLYKGRDTAGMCSELYRFIKKSGELAAVRREIFRSEKLFPVIWNNLPDGLLIISSDLEHIIDMNPGALRIFGIKKPGRIDFYDVSSDPNVTPELLTAIRDKLPGRFEIEYDFESVREKKSYPTLRTEKIVLELSVMPVAGAGSSEGIMIFVTETTGKKNHEKQLSKANRKLSLMSGMTRHDILNQVSAVRLGSELLSEHIGTDSEAVYYLELIEGCIEKIETQIKFTGAYENLGSYDQQWHFLEDIVLKAEKDVLAGDIRLFKNLGGYEVYADQMLVMVFINLFDNSLRHGETVTDIVLSFYDCGDEGVIVFEDNGIGIPDEIKEDIFQKGFGSDTGYGLYLIREILDFKGYSIKETGEAGKGARFEISVPAGKWRIQ